MDEATWRTCDDPQAMMSFLDGRACDRKRILFAVACCRRAGHLSTDPRHRDAIEAAERHADGDLGAAEFAEALQPVIDLWCGLPPRPDGGRTPWYYMTAATRHLSGDAASFYAARGLAMLQGKPGSPAWVVSLRTEEAFQCALIRDIFGLPFRPFRFDSSRLSDGGGPARALARAIEEGGRYEDLPLLADALEAAGCDEAAVLDHFRGPGPHVHGCWALDALLGREPAVREGLMTRADWDAGDDPASLMHFLRDKGSARKWRLFALACCRRIAPLITDERSRRAVEVAARHAAGDAPLEELEDARAAAQQAQDEAKRAEYDAEAQEHFCMTPRYATFGLRLFAAIAARGAASRDPLIPDATPGTFEAHCWKPSHEASVAALHYQLYAGLGADDPDAWQTEAVKEAIREIDATERRAHAEILRDLFGEHLGPPGDAGAWLPADAYGKEWWCALPTPVPLDPARERLVRDGDRLAALARSIRDEGRIDTLPALADALEAAGCAEPAILDHLRGPGPHSRGCWALEWVGDPGGPRRYDMK